MKKLILFTLLLGFIPQIAFSGDYIDRIETQIMGEWEGKFEHLFISHPEVRINLKLERVNLPDRMNRQISDSNPIGTVTITTNGKTETFSIYHVLVELAYYDGKESPQYAHYSISFKNKKKTSKLIFPYGIFHSTHNGVQLRDSAGFGSMTKR